MLAWEQANVWSWISAELSRKAESTRVNWWRRRRLFFAAEIAAVIGRGYLNANKK